MLMQWAVPAAAVLLAIAMLLNVYRLVAGPRTADRILALDTLYVNAAGLLVLFGLHTRSTLYFEAALLIAALGFIGTVALSKYLLRGDIIE